jgi:transcriptional regulator with XRE-family HTH domain
MAVGHLRVPKSLEATVRSLSRSIRERRLSLDLSQADLARLAGVSYRRVQQMESSDATLNPSLRLLFKLARALKLDIADLLSPVPERTGRRRAPKVANPVQSGTGGSTRPKVPIASRRR